MKLVINIPDGYKEKYKNVNNGTVIARMILNAVAEGTPIPDNCGRLVDGDLLQKEVEKDIEAAEKVGGFESAEELRDALQYLLDAPTVVPADKGHNYTVLAVGDGRQSIRHMFEHLDVNDMPKVELGDDTAPEKG